MREGIEFMDMRNHGEVIGCGRRAGRPLQRTAIPRIARDIAVFRQVTIADAYVKLGQLMRNADGNQDRSDFGKQQPWMPLRIIVMIQTPCHAHEAKHIERQEGEVETHQPKPEGALAEFLVELETKGLREPVVE